MLFTLVIKQRLSPGATVSSRGHRVMSEGVSDHPSWGDGCSSWHAAGRDEGCRPTSYGARGTAPRTENYPAPHVNHAKAEKP